MKIIIKFPTRERHDIFFDVIQKYLDLLSKKHDVSFMINCDADDKQMNNPQAISKMQGLGFDCYFEKNNSKIEAINANIPQLKEFDILMLASDDMVPVKKDYDDIIVQKMEKHFKDLDGVLWFNDGLVGENLNTFPIMGKKYFNRFGYIYNPEYKSFFCDGEFTMVATILEKQIYINETIIQHYHPTTGLRKEDDLFYKNSQYWVIDQHTYNRRKSINFCLGIAGNVDYYYTMRFKKENE